MIKNSELQNLREQLNHVDIKLIELIGSRFRLVKKIGYFKNSLGLEIRDSEREKILRDLIQKSAVDLEVEEGVLKEIFDILLNESIRWQQSLR